MFSLLTKDESKVQERVSYALLADLNINRILNLVTAGRGDEVRKLYGTFPADEEDAAYRRAVFADIKKEGVARAAG